MCTGVFCARVCACPYIHTRTCHISAYHAHTRRQALLMQQLEAMRNDLADAKDAMGKLNVPGESHTTINHNTTINKHGK
jgi:hypothetical protein